MAFHLLLASFARNDYICAELKKTMNNQLRGYVQCFQDRDLGQASVMHTDILRRDLNVINLANQDLTL